MTVELISLVEDYADVIDVVPASGVQPREDWLRQRKLGIGGSDAAAIAGVDPYRNALDVYHDKLSDDVRELDNPHIKRGRKLEALIAQEYLDRHPEDTINPPMGMMTHREHRWMIGTPDRIIASPRHAKKGLGILEIKCPAKPNYEKIKLNGVPPAYILQMQHYLAISDYTWGTFAIFNADSWEMILVDVERDDELIEQLIRVEEKFWNEHVVPQVPPVIAKEPPIKLPPTDRITIRADEKFQKAIDSYTSAQEMVKEAESLQEAAKRHLLDVIHEAPGVYETEKNRVYYTAVAGRKTLDKKALANSKPIDRTKLMLALAELEPEFPEITHHLTRKRLDLDLDLSQFESQGNDFMTLRVYPVKTGEK